MSTAQSAHTAHTFPAARIRPPHGGPAVEVSVIASLGRRGGDRLIESAWARQRAHEHFVDALDEPSARIGATDLRHGDATALYTFAVGTNGHPFHRHAGHRVFTAVSGSAGARLRFSTASTAEIEHDPQAFVAALHHVDIPPDCLFSVRFGGDTWHQFLPLRKGGAHPTLFAISCHTNELGGALTPEQHQRVLAGEADIPSLTELLPDSVKHLLDSATFDATGIPTTMLSLETTAASPLARCRVLWQRTLGRLRRMRSSRSDGIRVRSLAAVPQASLLRTQLNGAPLHEDTFECIVAADAFAQASASAALAALLQGFLDSRPSGVSYLMALRNALVKPLGLRTSPLGCPASSLLSATAPSLFAGRFPVLAQRIDAAGTCAEVILGADDKHLVFRSCVGVERLPDGRLRCSLGTRVRTSNRFGRFYLAAIDPVHRCYTTSAMLRQAVAHAGASLRGANGAPLTAENGESELAIGVSMATCRPPIPPIVSTRASTSAPA